MFYIGLYKGKNRLKTTKNMSQCGTVSVQAVDGFCGATEAWSNRGGDWRQSGHWQRHRVGVGVCRRWIEMAEMVGGCDIG